MVLTACLHPRSSIWLVQLLKVSALWQLTRLNLTDPVVSAFVQAYNAEFGENPNNPAGYAYDAANAIIAGLNATNCESREALNAWLIANMKDVKGVTGVITLDADGDRSFAPGMYTPIEIKDGAWVEVVE